MRTIEKAEELSVEIKDREFEEEENFKSNNKFFELYVIRKEKKYG